MNALKTKTTIYCNTCGCSLKRTKTIKVVAENQSEAVEEANAKIKIWKQTLNGQNCKVCQSIINDMNK